MTVAEAREKISKWLEQPHPEMADKWVAFKYGEVIDSDLSRKALHYRLLHVEHMLVFVEKEISPSRPARAESIAAVLEACDGAEGCIDDGSGLRMRWFTRSNPFWYRLHQLASLKFTILPYWHPHWRKRS